jgi:tRNA-splicing ligase RtcB
MNKKDLLKLDEYLWEIARGFRREMRVPARVYSSDKMLERAFDDKSLEQLVNVSTLPGIEKYALAMPDMHEGYGFPIGGVAAIDAETGVISPGGVGFDINCGMRVLKSDYQVQELRNFLGRLASEIQNCVPSGLGKGRRVKVSIGTINKILEGGAKKLVEQGYGEADDVERCEAHGFLEMADAGMVSEHAKNRGRDQVGTLGSGNHFLEIQKVERIFDKKTAEVFGLNNDKQVVVMIHTGSRGLGHQVATDYIRLMVSAMTRYKISLPDRQLAAVPFSASEGQRYFKAMCAAANFAWANRQMITYYVRKAWSRVLGKNAKPLQLVYDVAHNIAKLEEYNLDGKNKKLLIHRKGATRAFPPGHEELLKEYQSVGQPVLIPGSMGTASYILRGTEEGKEAFYSTCHGAGRTMSRKRASRSVTGQEVVRRLNQGGVIVKCHSLKGIAEEAPLAYKDIDSVVDVVHNAGLSKKVARLVPLAVIKGE